MKIVFITTLMEIALVVFILAVFFTIRYFVKANNLKMKSAGKENNPASAVSKAIILFVEKTGSFINNQPQIKPQLQVIPEKGRNFVTEVKEIVSTNHIPAMRAGTTINVNYNPPNTKEISLIKAMQKSNDKSFER